MNEIQCVEHDRLGQCDGENSVHEHLRKRTGIATENDRRIQRQLAESISEIVAREGRNGWSLAAPPSIHSAIVELLSSDVRRRMVEVVKSDLVKVEPAKLPGHFPSLQPW